MGDTTLIDEKFIIQPVTAMSTREEMTQSTEEEPVIKGWRRFVLINVSILLHMAGVGMSVTIFTDLVVYRTCLYTYQKNETECQLLRHRDNSSNVLKLESEVGAYASMIVMCRTLIENAFPAILSPFIGRWSGKHGRKPLLLSSSAGLTISETILAIVCERDMNPWFLLFSSCIIAASGGACATSIASLCHISDITNDADRTVLLAWFQSALGIGMLSGTFLGPKIYLSFGYPATFGTAAAVGLLSMLFILFCVPETITHRNTEPICGSFECSFDKDEDVDTNRITFNRTFVWLTILMLTLNALASGGDNTIEFLFTRARLAWDVETFSHYLSGQQVIRTIIVLFGVTLLSKFLGMSDMSLAIMGCTFSLIASVSKLLTFESWHMYFAMVFGSFNGMVEPVIRSHLSKIVPPKYTSQMFSYATSSQTIIGGLGSAPLYSLVYSHYLPPIYPSPVWMLSVAIYAIALLFLIGMRVLKAKTTHVPVSQEDH